MDGATLLNGSFNWTRAAVLGNEENVVISSAPELVAAFQERFEALWKQYKGKEHRDFDSLRALAQKAHVHGGTQKLYPKGTDKERRRTAEPSNRV